MVCYEVLVEEIPGYLPWALALVLHNDLTVILLHNYILCITLPERVDSANHSIAL